MDFDWLKKRDFYLKYMPSRLANKTTLVLDPFKTMVFSPSSLEIFIEFLATNTKVLFLYSSIYNNRKYKIAALDGVYHVAWPLLEQLFVKTFDR